MLPRLIFGWNAELDPLYVVLLALFNDATITPIAHDNATPSPTPETPTVGGLLAGALALGLLQAASSVAFFVHGEAITGIAGFLDDDRAAVRQVAVYCQISIAVELLIFACRAPKPVFAGAVMQRRFNVKVPRARVPGRAPTRRERSER